jgi:hydroxymethylbilane synthase
MTPPPPLILGTRGSLLAKMQSQWVADALMRSVPDLRVQIEIIQTTGDVVRDRPLHEIGGKGLFTKEIEQSLLDKKIDFAVHSFKDVPITMPLVDVSELVIAAVPAREDVRDVLIGATSVDELSYGARIGTSSLRRKCQLLACRPDLDVQMIRGNIDTRLRKLRDKEFGAIILAMAGLKRAGLYDATRMFPIPLEQMLPAAGQGALALQCRREDLNTRQFLEKLNDPATAACVEIERQVVRRLNGDCHSPIAALAVMNEYNLQLRIAIGRRDGHPPVQQASAVGSDFPGVLEQAMQNLEPLSGKSP